VKQPFALDGFPEAIDNLLSLPLALQRPVLRKVMADALQPLSSAVKSASPHLYGDLERNLIIGTRLNKRQTSLNRVDKATVEVHFGTSDPAGIANEFGNNHQSANPFFRSNWEREKQPILTHIKQSLGPMIELFAARRAKRLARK